MTPMEFTEFLCDRIDVREDIEQIYSNRIWNYLIEISIVEQAPGHMAECRFT